jgi:hypothetical protein
MIFSLIKANINFYRTRKTRVLYLLETVAADWEQEFNTEGAGPLRFALIEFQQVRI